MHTKLSLDERMRQIPDQAVLPRHELGPREWVWVEASLHHLHDQDHPTAATFAAILQYCDSERATPLQKELHEAVDAPPARRHHYVVGRFARATPLQKELHEAVDAVLGLTSPRQGGTTTLWDALRAPYWPHVVARHEALAANKVPLPFVLSLQQILARTLACLAHLLQVREGWRLFDEDWVFVVRHRKSTFFVARTDPTTMQNRAVPLIQDIVKNGPDWHDLIQQHRSTPRSLGHRALAYTPGGRAASSAGIADTLFA
ncbi:hypothetical protein Rhopal_003968-T1 [Rhodotorula paludigena]|uniref:Uncharacterized protein n=1 Tax=Rhodotorula paludigena TaxID=86838 RepID=A0AAV5GKE7_9BASI|nr:hypothetical protein Rhopal_003968-T1 [Rhodotorula paludigena]